METTTTLQSARTNLAITEGAYIAAHRDPFHLAGLIAAAAGLDDATASLAYIAAHRYVQARQETVRLANLAANRIADLTGDIARGGVGSGVPNLTELIVALDFLAAAAVSFTDVLDFLAVGPYAAALLANVMTGA